MENLSSLLGGRTSTLLSLDGGEGKVRKGARISAFDQFAEACVKAEAEGMTIPELAEYVESLRDPATAPGTKNGKVKSLHAVGISKKGNHVYVQTPTPRDLEENFQSAFVFARKKDALSAVDARNCDLGTKIF
jgi:hypothetical protein